jgi:hypothetical protein
MILKQVLKGLRDSRDTFLYTHHPISTGKATDVTTATLLLVWSMLLLSLQNSNIFFISLVIGRIINNGSIPLDWRIGIL